MPKFCAPSRHRSSEHLKTATCLEGDVATSRSAPGFVFVSSDHSYGPKGMPQRGDRTQPRVLTLGTEDPERSALKGRQTNVLTRWKGRSSFNVHIAVAHSNYTQQ
jgi:hypothetical protein